MNGFVELSSAERAKRLEKDRVAILGFFHQFLTKVSKVEFVQAVLLLLRQVLEEDPSTATAAQALVNSGSKDALSEPCFLLMEHPDWYISYQATHVLKVLMSDPSIPAKLAKKFLDDMTMRLKATGDNEAMIHESAAAGLQAMLRLPSNRQLFMQVDDGLHLVVGLCKRYRERSNPQLLYVLMYVMWLLSFDAEVAPRMGEVVLGPVIEVARKVSKEKVVRLSLAILRNLQQYGNNAADMIVLDLIKVLSTLAQRQWDDEDVVSDIKFLQESLFKDVHELSSFETYKKEVLSGELTWSPVHKSETFWRENIMKFEANDFQMLRYLTNLLQEPQDPKVLAVACFDIGEFIHYHPHGKTAVTQLKIKPKLMALLTHNDARVKKEALLAVQKLLVQNWEAIGGDK